MSYAVGVDIGGTFTDCVAVDHAGRVHHGKALSTHGTSPAEGVLRGLTQLAESADETLDSLLEATDQFSHGTTIGTNLIVERKGARVGLIATRGHGDALIMMRGQGRSAGEPAATILNIRDTDKPAPLVSRWDVAEVIERVAVDGSVLVPLDEVSARRAVTTLLGRGVEAISVALLWSFRNPTHEQRLRDIVAELAPDMYVSISSDTAPRQGEYERTVATVINSYLGPASSRYLEELAISLANHGLRSRPFIMQANGGVIPVQVAARRPVQTIGSGPAGGLAGTADIASRAGHRNVIATDMGGTSFEVGLLVGGRPVLASENIIDKYTFRISHLDLRSIACGGGSIARVDPRGGGLQVGPESAGSVPGPACYGTGTQATVTDADVVLGLIDPDRFLNGRMSLNRDAAVKAVGTLAEATGLSLEHAAAGILRVNGHNAATLIRQRTIEQGLDPRDFTVYAFGGAGPVHAFTFAQELGVKKVLIPMGNGASTLSAYGIAASDAMQVFERECTLPAPVDGSALATVTADLERLAVHEMTAAGFNGDSIRLHRSALGRYAGQFLQELVLPMDDGEVGDVTAKALEEAFLTEYSRLYGKAALSAFHTPEIFMIRVSATVELGVGTAPSTSGDGGAQRPSRPVFWPGDNEWTDTAVYDGPPALGSRIPGPALVQLPHTTISVSTGWQLNTDGTGNCVLAIEEEQEH